LLAARLRGYSTGIGPAILPLNLTGDLRYGFYVDA
jgi:hypothetical protein